LETIVSLSIAERNSANGVLPVFLSRARCDRILGAG